MTAAKRREGDGLPPHFECRSEIHLLRAERDRLQGQLDIVYDAEYSRSYFLERKVERLEALGDALADAVDDHLRGAGEWGPLVEERRAWRAAR